MTIRTSKIVEFSVSMTQSRLECSKQILIILLEQSLSTGLTTLCKYVFMFWRTFGHDPQHFLEEPSKYIFACSFSFAQLIFTFPFRNYGFSSGSTCHPSLISIGLQQAYNCDLPHANEMAKRQI